MQTQSNDRQRGKPAALWQTLHWMNSMLIVSESHSPAGCLSTLRSVRDSRHRAAMGINIRWVRNHSNDKSHPRHRSPLLRSSTKSKQNCDKRYPRELLRTCEGFRIMVTQPAENTHQGELDDIPHQHCCGAFSLHHSPPAIQVEAK